ncbi:MAG: glutamine amidotransferase subunit PdxT [Chloroflexi bacterium RBG_13_56_8]|nr:MAG: glutamine amidotransferase subunit PdxT [Chloroflexi bacterium RBG_13_56_8]
MRIGVLALQGAFREHLRALADLGVDGVAVRLPRHLEGLDGLIIPGGESTTIAKLAILYGLISPLCAFAKQGKPIWGTCAGLIFLARDLIDYEEQPRLGLLDIAVQRNAFGRQVDSFVAPLHVAVLDQASKGEEQGQPFPAVFIRAPVIEAMGEGVQVLAQLEGNGTVAVQQGTLLGTAFHPELTTDRRFHSYFLSLVANGHI